MAAELEAAQDLARSVSLSFLNQYYEVLVHEPERVGKFYGVDSVMRYNATESFHGQEDIKGAYVALDFSGMEVDIKNVSYLPTPKKECLLVVTGEFVSRAQVTRKFSQSFFLAPTADQASYGVLSDILVCVDGPAFVAGGDGDYIADNEEVDAQEDVEEEVPDQASAEANEDVDDVEEDIVEIDEGDEEIEEPIEAEEQPDELQEDEVEEPVSVEKVQEEEESAADAAVEKDEAETGADSSTKKEVPSFSYAHAVSKFSTTNTPATAAVSAPAPPAKPAASSAASGKAAPAAAAAAKPTSSKKSEPKKSDSGPAIFAKDIRKEWTADTLKDFFTQFGAVQSVDIPSGKQYAFVYFSSADSVAAVLSAPEIVCEGKTLICEEKNSTGSRTRSRGGGRDRSGKGGAQSGSGKGGSFKGSNANGTTAPRRNTSGGGRTGGSRGGKGTVAAGKDRS